VTYHAHETSEQDGRPVEIYRFTIGSDPPYLYTSAEDTITVAGETYAPIAIMRGSIVQGPDERSRPLEVTMPGTAEFARRFAGIVPGQSALLTLRRFHRDDGATPQVITSFIGTVHAARFGDDGQSLVFPVYSLEYGLSKTVPRFGFQSVCNNVLYDFLCGVDEDDPANKFTSTVTAISGNDITVAGAGAFGGGNQFSAGFAKPQAFNDFRTILGQAGDVLTLMLPFPMALLGSTVVVYRGCDHLIEGDCSLKHANVGNNGGYPWVPRKNPFVTGLD